MVNKLRFDKFPSGFVGKKNSEFFKMSDVA